MGGKSQTTSSSSTYAPNAQAAGVYSDILSRAQQVASQPYTPYNGQLTAGLTDTQQSGIDNINSAYGTAQPYIDQAAGYANNSAGAINDQDLSRYLNPFQSNVIDSTMANIRENEGQQQQSLKGNAIAKGAWGGDRAGVAQAELARQQGLASNQTLAGLQSQNYTQALAAAQADKQRQAQGAQLLGGLGTTAQNSALQGAQAQLGAGGLEQQTNQANLSAQYQQFLQQQAFPYQQLGFLSGVASPIGGALGGTQSGTATQPGPSPVSQIIGAGVAASPYILSDERAKEDVKQVGELYDGQPVYRFKYKGSPTTQIGLMAQDVEQTHPFAVKTIDGIKGVDYEAATEDAADQDDYASGGRIGGSPIDYMTDVGGYIPQVKIAAAPRPSLSLPSAPKSNNQGAADAKGVGSLAGMFGSSMFDGAGSPMSLSADGMGYTPSAMGDMTGMGQIGGTGLSGYGGLYAHGGFVEAVHAIRHGLKRKKADGGSVGPFADRFDASWSPDDPLIEARFPMAGEITVPSDLADNRDALINRGQQRLAEMPQAPQQAPQQVASAVPLPRPRSPMASPMAAPDDDMPPQFAQLDPELPDDAMAYDRRRQSFPMQAPAAMAPQGQPMQGQPQEAPQKRGFGLLPMLGIGNGISDEAASGLMAAGLGMMSGTSPFAGVNIGQGGLQGLAAYSGAKKTKQDQEFTRTRIENEGKRLAQQAEHQAAQLAETSRYHTGTLDRHDANLQRQLEANKISAMRPVKIGVDSMARDIYGIPDPKGGGYQVIDPKTGMIGKKVDGPMFPVPGTASAVPPEPGSELPAGSGAVEGEAPQGANEAMLKSLEPEVANTVKAIAEGRMAITSVPMKQRAQMSALVTNYDPTYDATRFTTRNAKARQTGPVMDEKTVNFMASRVAAGDSKALTGIGKGAQGSENLALINKRVAELAESGIDIDPAAAQILRNQANQASEMSAGRALGTKSVHFGVAEKAMEESLPIALAASKEVPRTEWKALTELVQKGQTQINDPKLKKFLIATDTAVKDYARTINPSGQTRQGDIDYARKLVSTADSPAAYEAAMAQLKVEAGVTRRALERQKEELKTGKHAPMKDTAHEPAASTASKFAPAPAVGSRDTGTVYQTPKGPAKWMGNGWQLVQ